MRQANRTLHLENLAFSRSCILYNMDYRQKMVVASNEMRVTDNGGEDDDDEDLEALRMAALRSLRAKDTLRTNSQPWQQTKMNSQQIAQPCIYYKGQRPSKHLSGIYQARVARQNGGLYFQRYHNPNLITIVPVEESIVPPLSVPFPTSFSAGSPTRHQLSDESKFCRYNDNASGSEEEDDGDHRRNISKSKKPETEVVGAEESGCSEMAVLSDVENTSMREESPQRSDEDNEEEDDDDVLLMADHEEEDSLERLMDEMEREMSIDKPIDVIEKRQSRRGRGSSRKEEVNRKEKHKAKLEPKRTNRSSSPTVMLSSIHNVFRIESRPLPPSVSSRLAQRRRSLSPKPRSRKKSPRRSPRRSPARQTKKLQRDGGRENLHFRSPRKSPARFSPRLSPRRSPNRSPLRLSPRLLSPRPRSPRLARSRSPRLHRSRSPRSSPRRSPVRLSPRRLSPKSRSPKLSPRRVSPQPRSPRISPRRMSPHMRTPRTSPRLSPRRLSPRVRSPRRVSPGPRSPALSPHRLPWSSPRHSPRLSPRRRKSPKELGRKLRVRSVTPNRHQSPLPNCRIKNSPDDSVKSKVRQKEVPYDKVASLDTGKGMDSVSSDPVLEARRRKFESTTPIDPVIANKKIKLCRKESRDRKSDLSDDTENGITNLPSVYKVDEENEYEFFETETYLGTVFTSGNIGEAIENSPDATLTSAVIVCSEMEPAELEREKPAKKKKKKDKEIYQVHKLKGELPLSERIGKEKKSKKRPEVSADGSVEKTETVFEDLTIDEEEGDLRTELSRRRAERLNRTGPIPQQSVRLVQSAFKGVVSEVVKSNAKNVRKQQIRGDDKQNQKEVRRVTVLHRPASELQESDEEATMDSKVPIRFRLGLNQVMHDTREPKVSRHNSRRQNRKE